jgi:hypothetical protein
MNCKQHTGEGTARAGKGGEHALVYLLWCKCKEAVKNELQTGDNTARAGKGREHTLVYLLWCEEAIKGELHTAN